MPTHSESSLISPMTPSSLTLLRGMSDKDLLIQLHANSHSRSRVLDVLNERIIKAGSYWDFVCDAVEKHPREHPKLRPRLIAAPIKNESVPKRILTFDKKRALYGEDFKHTSEFLKRYALYFHTDERIKSLDSVQDFLTNCIDWCENCGLEFGYKDLTMNQRGYYDIIVNKYNAWVKSNA